MVQQLGRRGFDAASEPTGQEVRTTNFDGRVCWVGSVCLLVLGCAMLTYGLALAAEARGAEPSGATAGNVLPPSVTVHAPG